MKSFRPDLSRFPGTKPRGARVVLADTHKASKNAETLFPTRVFHASVVKSILKSGHNSPKTGKMVEKGRWAGMPIYTLTLEERATCSRACRTWDRCYGNNMQYAERIINDEIFENRLWLELHVLNAKHDQGFVIRLHILGDFYSEEYVELWAKALVEFPNLNFYGYTGREPDTTIGKLLMHLNIVYADRVRIRFSGFDAGGMGSLVIKSIEDSKHTVCPAELEKTACCGTCGFCWTANGVVEFLEH